MGLGMPEVILILVIALIVFGPRKLPDLGKSLGQAMSQFRRASDDFKRTWEQEVDLEKTRKDIAGSDYQHNSGTSDGSNNYGSSNEPYNPYDPYANEQETTKPTAEGDASNSSEASPENKTPTNVEAPVTTAQTPAKAHWI